MPLEVTIANERTKLTANALDRASTAFGAGAVLQVLGWIKPDDPSSSARAGFVLFLFIAASVLLHHFAGRTLGDLRE